MKKNKIFISVAQTASELAIFGAILIFVLGLIIRYAVNFNYIQNQSLEAMRLALQQSWLSADLSHNASRNLASVLFIEDRKDVDITSGSGITDGKFGALTRTPYIVGGSGTFTKNLFMFLDWGFPEDLPILDMFINGKHLTFQTAGFKSYQLLNDTCTGLQPGSVNEYDATCFKDRLNNNVGCAKLYTRIPNPTSSGKWCVTDGPPCYGEKRFDLDRNGTTDVIGMPLRANFSWEWYPVKATSKNINLSSGENVSVDVDGDLKEEQILSMTNCANTVVSTPGSGPGFGFPQFFNDQVAIRTVNVLDGNAGDLDLSYNSWDAKGGYTPATGVRIPPPPRAGLKDDTFIYTLTDTGHGGTYLRVEEGKLYSGKQFIRSIEKHDQADIIERQVQLSNDTGRFCDNAGNPSSSNPAVEACNNCFSQANIFRTCFDQSSKILYVRSRISDTTGKKWMTDVSADKMPIK